MDYKNAGVDIEAGYKSVELMKKHVKETMRPEVLGGLGGFAGAFDLSGIKQMDEPVLLSGTDGCGTKVKLAFIMDKHDTIGLVGGETAEHPGLMPEDEYDLAGFAVGVADKKEIVDGKDIRPGDVLIGMASSGVHSNGFSLVRKVFEMTKESLNTYYEELGKTLGEALIMPTRIYVEALKSIRGNGVKIKGCSHITGGGFYENIPRMLPEGARAVIEKDSYEVPAIFKLLAQKGEIAEEMMYNTFNMGLGMVVAVDSADADKTLEAIKASGERPYIVGRIEAGEKGVTLC